MKSLEEFLLGEKVEIDESLVTEVERKIRVNSKGKKRVLMRCKKGFKLSSDGKSCVPISGSEKTNKKLAIRQSVRTKNQNPSGKRKAAFRQKRALKKREAYGLS